MSTLEITQNEASLIYGPGPSATNPSNPNGGTTSSPKNGYTNRKPDTKQRKTAP